jgi:hypothetical protein
MLKSYSSLLTYNFAQKFHYQLLTSKLRQQKQHFIFEHFLLIGSHSLLITLGLSQAVLKSTTTNQFNKMSEPTTYTRKPNSNCLAMILEPIQHESRFLIWVNSNTTTSPIQRRRVPTFEPLGRPSVEVGPEVPLHRRRGGAKLRLQQYQHHRIAHASSGRQQPGTTRLDLRIREQIAGDLEAPAPGAERARGSYRLARAERLRRLTG